MMHEFDILFGVVIGITCGFGVVMLVLMLASIAFHFAIWYRTKEKES